MYKQLDVVGFFFRHIKIIECNTLDIYFVFMLLTFYVYASNMYINVLFAYGHICELAFSHLDLSQMPVLYLSIECSVSLLRWLFLYWNEKKKKKKQIPYRLTHYKMQVSIFNSCKVCKAKDQFYDLSLEMGHFNLCKRAGHSVPLIVIEVIESW